jgi:hypothetical protein
MRYVSAGTKSPYITIYIPHIVINTLIRVTVVFLTHIIIEQIARNKEQRENASDFDKDGYTKR